MKTKKKLSIDALFNSTIFKFDCDSYPIRYVYINVCVSIYHYYLPSDALIGAIGAIEHEVFDRGGAASRRRVV